MNIVYVYICFSRIHGFTGATYFGFGFRIHVEVNEYRLN